MSFLERYSRTILVEEVGFNGQTSISSAKILLIGAGGISASVFAILVASGVKEITIWEGDFVEPSNLQRQFLFKEQDLGQKKATLLKNFATLQNSNVTVNVVEKMLTEETFEEFLLQAKNFNLVVDGTDSFASRSLSNKACVNLGLPFFTGACIEFTGQVYSFFASKNTPCYACIFGSDYKTFRQGATCATRGVIPSLPSIIGSIITQNVLQFLTNSYTQNMFEKLILIDFLKQNHFKESTIKKEPLCQICLNTQN